LVRSTIAEGKGKLSKYESADLAIVRSFVSTCKDAEEHGLVLGELERHKLERTYVTNFCVHSWCEDSRLHLPVTQFVDQAIEFIKNGAQYRWST
jgi:hypothetical protein